MIPLPATIIVIAAAGPLPVIIAITAADDMITIVAIIANIGVTAATAAIDLLRPAATLEAGMRLRKRILAGDSGPDYQPKPHFSFREMGFSVLARP